MSATILDGFGRPYAFQGSTPGPYESPSVDGMFIAPPRLDDDMAAMLPRYKHRCMLSDSRYIASPGGIGSVSGALEQKAQYVNQAGWLPHFEGRDQKWGDRMLELLESTHKIINVRGPLFPWDKSWQISSKAPDIDGDCFVLLGKTADAFPQLQFLEAHRIGGRYTGENIVPTGPYQGLKILNGIVYNGPGREVAYLVTGATPEEDRYVSARDMIHVCDPRWHSDGRPFPSVSYAIKDWYSIKSARELQHTKQRVNAALTMVETTATGGPSETTMTAARQQFNAAAAAAAGGQPRPPQPGTPAKPIVEVLAGGLIRYVKSGAGDIKSHSDTSPGSSWLDFDKRIEQGAMFAMGWHSAMLDLSNFAGAPTRGFADQINTSIYARWLAMYPFVLRAELYTMACLIQRGDIEENAEWWKWAFTPPAEFTVDAGRTNKADIDNVRAGVDSRPGLIGRAGKQPRQILRAEARYLQLQAETEKEFGLPPGSLATLAVPGLQANAPAEEPATPPRQAPPAA